MLVPYGLILQVWQEGYLPSGMFIPAAHPFHFLIVVAEHTTSIHRSEVSYPLVPLLANVRFLLVLHEIVCLLVF